MRVLITGANGFVGTNVSRYLTAQGLKCLALDIAGAPEQGDYAARYTWDALEAIPWREVGAVIHLAGKAHDTKNASDPQSYFDINVGLTTRILSALVHYCESALVEESEKVKAKSEKLGAGGSSLVESEAGNSKLETRGSIGHGGEITHELTNYRTNALKKFIFFSSVKACADAVDGVLTEEHVPMPQTPYGTSKLEAEGVVRSALVHYCDSALVGATAVGDQGLDGSSETNELTNYRTNALSCYILRPAMIHGPGNKGNLNLLYKVIQKGIPWPLGAFENQRSFTSIENVSRVLEALIKTDVEPGTYQIADDEPLSTNQVIGLIAASLGRTPKTWSIAPGLMRRVARVGDVLHLPLNSERLKKLTESYVVSNRKLLRALGWQKMPVSAQEGMRATLVATYCDH